ncbi:MAG: AlpA family phage regulatory protein [Pasteurellaceae bacterium]|nr:AlpA family phage regulatory protein [Pasteurellaceae bacterium]
MELVKRLDAVKQLGTSRSMLDRWVNPKDKYYRPDFPKPIKSGRAVMFIKEELDEYIKKLAQAN